MARIFVYDNRRFPDPDPSLSVDEVRRQLGVFFPELNNAETGEERRGEDTLYTFGKRIGTKGAPFPMADILQHVPAKRLRVFELAVELIDAEGELDVDAAGCREPEISLAIAEADAYARATRGAVEALRALLDP